MLRIDIKNKDFEIDGDGQVLLVEFVELGRKLTEVMSDKMEISQEDFLSHIFKTIKFAIDRNDNNN